MKKGFAEISNKNVQRAVIFQGGGAIGAYAAGVYAVLYHWVKKNIVADENVFDVVAGSSAGAINACIIVSHVVHNKNNGKLQRWEGSVKKLLDFWYDTSSSPDFTKWKPFFSYDWPFFKNDDDWISVWNATRT
jgi:NTE family protein